MNNAFFQKVECIGVKQLKTDEKVDAIHLLTSYCRDTKGRPSLTVKKRSFREISYLKYIILICF